MTLFQWLFVVGFVATGVAALWIRSVNARFASYSGYDTDETEKVKASHLEKMELSAANLQEISKVSELIDTSTNIEEAKHRALYGDVPPPALTEALRHIYASEVLVEQVAVKMAIHCDGEAVGDSTAKSKQKETGSLHLKQA